MLKMWNSFKCSSSELNLNIVLACGQSFRWSKNSEDEWTGVTEKTVWKLKQGEGSVFFKSYKQIKDEKSPSDADYVQDDEQFLRDYFQLNVVLKDLYERWGKTDENFYNLSQQFGGIRMLRQDPVENLFSFICSQNNHISRISSMVEKLCVNYGDFLCEIDNNKYYSFPSIFALSEETVEPKLRELGFGYRAKFIHHCAKKILADHNKGWLYALRNVAYKDAHKALCELPGVGAKVADCVCLMSLDKAEAIPVDTHMWQIAQRDYLPHLKKYKTLTDKIYQEIGDLFRGIYGDYSGWAHSVLFSADLKKFQGLKQAALKPDTGNEKPAKPNRKKQSTSLQVKIEKPDEKPINFEEKSPSTSNLSDKVLKRRSSRLATGGKNPKILKE